jgi:hypothetical protein
MLVGGLKASKWVDSKIGNYLFDVTKAKIKFS